MCFDGHFLLFFFADKNLAKGTFPDNSPKAEPVIVQDDNDKHTESYSVFNEKIPESFLPPSENISPVLNNALPNYRAAACYLKMRNDKNIDLHLKIPDSNGFVL